jgi:hypothetical protein
MKTETGLGTVTLALLRRLGRMPVPESPISVPMGRLHLPAFTRELGFTRGAEIGVWKGEFSAKFCEGNPDLEMLCVDPWQAHDAWHDRKKSQGPDAEKILEGAYQEACARLRPLKATILREFSVEAAKTVPDGSLDFVYIDGNHVLDAVLEDLAAWVPKVRVGGFVSGHDYRVNPAKPFIQVVPAVNRWTAEHQIQPWFVLSSDPSASFLWEVH